MPLSTRWASARARAVSRLKMADERPNSEVVGQAQQGFVALGTDHHRDRSEGFLGIELHLGGDAIQQGRLEDAAVELATTDQPGALATASSIMALMRVPALASISEPSTESACTGITRLEECAPGRQALDEGVGDTAVDQQALGGHADLPLVEVGAKGCRGDRGIQVGVFQHQQRRLAPSSSTAGLRWRADSSPTMRPTRVEPVKLTRRTAGLAISRSTMAGASSGALVTTLTTPSPSPASCSTWPISRCTPGLCSDALSTTVIAAGQRHGQGAGPQDHRRVPGRDTQHHATGLAQGHGEAAGTSEGMTSPWDLGGHGRRLAQHVGGQVDIEAVPVGHGPVSPARATNSPLRAARPSAAASKRRRRSPAATPPRREGGLGRGHRGVGIVQGGGGHRGDHRAVTGWQR